MPDKPFAAVGSGLVQIVGLLILIGGLFELPSAGGVIASICGGVLLAAATLRYHRYSGDQ